MADSRVFKLFFLAFCSMAAFSCARVHPAQAAFTDERELAPDPVKSVSTGALWHNPGDISSVDLTYGRGGKEHAPRSEASYTFEKEDLAGTSAKFYVKDDQGVEWLVKVGDEARPETAASRFVWAMGYFTDEDYFLPRLHVSGIAKLHRKSKSIHKDGTVINARLKRTQSGLRKLDNWQWRDNPFLGSRELNGLRVMMALINNWDLKTDNNKIYGPKDSKKQQDVREGSLNGENDEGSGNDGKERSSDISRDVRYVVSDLGASFGRTGAFFSRSKGKVKDYAKDNFIRATTPETVDFVMRIKPGGMVRLLKPGYSRQRVAMAETVESIPRADAKWIGSQLARLAPEQIRSAFLAAGFTPKEAEGFTTVLSRRIAELNAL